MATTNYSFNLPTVGGDDDVWGDLLNANWTALDAQLFEGVIGADTTGSAATLTTPRTLTVGDTGKLFDGAADITWSVAEIGALAADGSIALTGDFDANGNKVTSLAEGVEPDDAATVGQLSTQVPDPQDDTDTEAYRWAVGDVQGAVIVESDSNANGRFVKYSDGTMIAYFTIPNIDPNMSSGNGFRSDDFTWTFPVAFSSTPNVVTGAKNANIWGSASTPSTTEVDMRLLGFLSRTGIDASVLAIGRWK